MGTQSMATIAQLQCCVLCNGETHEGTTTLEFAFDGVTVIVDGVPATVCDSCDEAYIDGPLGVSISEFAAEIAEKIAASVRGRANVGDTTVRTRIDSHELTKSLAF